MDQEKKITTYVCERSSSLTLAFTTTVVKFKSHLYATSDTSIIKEMDLFIKSEKSSGLRLAKMDKEALVAKLKSNKLKKATDSVFGASKGGITSASSMLAEKGIGVNSDASDAVVSTKDKDVTDAVHKEVTTGINKNKSK